MSIYFSLEVYYILSFSMLQYTFLFINYLVDYFVIICYNKIEVDKMRLKRKLKPQFLPNNYLDKNSKISNSIDNIEKKIIKGCISFLLIILLLCWSIIPSIVIHILNIDKTTLSNTTTIIISLINDILFITLMIGIYYKSIKKDIIKYFNHNFFSNLGISVVYWLSGLVIMVISNYIIAIVMNGQLAENEELVRNMVATYPWYMAFNIMIYAPITEELIFRKSIRDICNNKWIYVIASGLIFGGLHVISSLTNIASLLYLIPYCSLGITFALLYYKTNNIFSSIIAHSLHNTLALILYLIIL